MRCGVSGELLVDSLVVHELRDPIHPGIAASARGGRPLKTVAAFGEGVEVRLDSHPAKLLPAFYRVHGCPTIGIAVHEEHRAGRKVEGELGSHPGIVLISTALIMGVCSID